MTTRWLAERIDLLLGLLAPLGHGQEEEMARICAQEIAAWRARPSITKESTLRNPMTDTRNAIRERLEVTAANRWLNPQTQQYEHLALQYMNFTEEEWIRVMGDTQERFQRRLEEQQLLEQPDVLVQQAEALLHGEPWYELALGLAIATGRRSTEILKTAKLYPKTPSTILFEGQLKKRDLLMKPYEIPTLVEADLVLSAWRRLRALVDCSTLELDEVNNRYGSVVRALANERLRGLIPLRSSKEFVTTHLNRCIYGRLCVFYFAPSHVPDITYMATIYGHYWSAGEEEDVQRNYQSTLHYYDYVIGDGHGQVDRRQGIRLGEPGVEILEIFRPKEPRKEKPMAKKRADDQPTMPTKGHSIVRCTPQTRARFVQEERERGFFKDQNGLLSQLLDESILYRQGVQLLQPATEQLGAESFLQTLQALLEPQREQGRLDAQFKERWGISLAEVDALFQMIHDAGHDNPLKYVQEGVSKQDNLKAGAQKRQDHFRKKDFSQMPYSQLKDVRASAAADERIRRAILAIQKHNHRAQPVDRWYINAAVINGLIKTRFPIINAYLQEHQQDIDTHHQHLGIEPRYNRSKLVPVGDMIQIPDLPDQEPSSLPATTTLQD
ncbi:protelomerase family protein [Dictyobacter arantiisoli]|nr:protelomerase family protein [Dictyobacter arantiisoli]